MGFGDILIKLIIDFFKFLENKYDNIRSYDYIYLDFIKNPYNILMFIFFLIFNLMTIPLYLLFYFFYLFYWFIILILYVFNIKSEIKIKEIKFEFKGFFLTFFYVRFLLSTYVTSYSVLYYSLKNIINKQTNNKLLIFFEIIFNFVVRIITGVSRRVLVDSFFWSLKFSNFSDIKNCKNTITYNILLNIMSDNLKFEYFRIYKTKEKKFNFNPPKLITKLEK